VHEAHRLALLVHKPDDLELAYPQVQLAALHLREGNRAAARPLLESILAVAEKTGSKTDATEEAKFRLAGIIAREDPARARALAIAGDERFAGRIDEPELRDEANAARRALAP
jgi:hypothetical protein